ncbi:hypothetical protein GLAREA_03157 [Glarea lozoyensis ATCC 20868]|uniref:Uncharacterized protein n=1 Tax=Glarea lozoyensis (strain ATCC 20868 / MF5171) TaxID=1116229 RepID=S3CL58_GLAL2|nr:uncharacterized protein GLAREA_03157 [Glarea lozoyensis ATCC 20868]EPE27242.1 hypothetical protein GLAREA_03157 [Glarea lozoyensis ATCC 20868]
MSGYGEDRHGLFALVPGLEPLIFILWPKIAIVKFDAENLLDERRSRRAGPQGEPPRLRNLQIQLAGLTRDSEGI